MYPHTFYCPELPEAKYVDPDDINRYSKIKLKGKEMTVMTHAEYLDMVYEINRLTDERDGLKKECKDLRNIIYTLRTSNFAKY